MATRRALILGISGQDGSYLANLLLDLGYIVIGCTRDASRTKPTNLDALRLRDRVELRTAELDTVDDVSRLLESTQPDEIYNLSGQTSVAQSFAHPRATINSFVCPTLNILESIRLLGVRTRYFNACSSECFGDSDEPATEDTPIRPLSPYAAAKAASLHFVTTYRQCFGIFACSGFLFNHESPLRPAHFVTTKIVDAACRIAAGERLTLKLGNLNVWRDWGWAPEYVAVMHRILQQPDAEDFVIATGESHSLETFVRLAFATKGLNYVDHTTHSVECLRPTEIQISRANPTKARRILNWKAVHLLPSVVTQLVDSYECPQ
jgi:GDPmannose 4,6-dehydratase